MSSTPPPDAPAARRRWAVPAPGLETLFVAALALWGFRLGAKAIKDNSMLLHLRTGIDIAHGRGIPSEDPYSFTARGEDWTVQSWLAEASYGVLERIGGFELVVLQQAVLMAAVALVMVVLARTGRPLHTAAAGVIAIGIGSPYWVPRPLLVGLLALAVVILIVERRRSPWWLVPLVWVWANAHGSFALGLGWVVLRAAGEALDTRAWPRRTLPYAGTFLAGLAVSLVNPVGLRLLAFPLKAAERRDLLRTFIEWRTPDFGASDGLVALSFLTLAMVVLFRARAGWVDILPVAAFVAAGLLTLRNVPVAAVVVAPALGRALRQSEPADAEPPSAPIALAFVAVLAVAFGTFASAIWSREPLDLRRYPVAAVDWMDEEGLLGRGHRVAHNERVGDYLILRFGEDARVFVDDRLDMYPERVVRDVDVLVDGGTGAFDVLDRHDIDVVLWPDGSALTGILELSGDWSRVYNDDTWVVMRRT